MDGYQIRANSILERLKQMNKEVDIQKQVKSNQLLEEYSNIQTLILNSQSLRNQHLHPLQIRIHQLKQILQQHSSEVTSINTQIVNAIKRIQTNARQMISRNKKQQQLVQKSLRHKLNQYLSEMERLNQENHQQKSSTIKRYKLIVQVELPQLLKQIKQEKASRAHVQIKMIQQFLQQFQQIKLSLQEQIQVRKDEEQEMVGSLKTINNSLEAKIKKQKQIRQQSELELQKLISTVLTRIKCEVLN